MQWRWNRANDLQVTNVCLPRSSQRRRPLQRVWLKMSLAQVLDGSNAKMQVSIFRDTPGPCTTHGNLLFGLLPVGIYPRQKTLSDSKVQVTLC